MEQLVLLLIIAAISLINWLIEKSAKLREQKRLQKDLAERTETSTAPLAPAPPPLGDPQQERLRDLLESFGIPTPEPAPPVAQREPVFFFESEPMEMPPPLPPPPAVRAQPTPSRRLPAAIVSRAATTSWAKRFRSPAAVREAIVLREILAPPRSIEPY